MFHPLCSLLKKLRICDWRIGTPRRFQMCNLRFNHKNCGLANSGLANMEKMRSCDSEMSRVTIFGCKWKRKFYRPPLPIDINTVQEHFVIGIMPAVTNCWHTQKIHSPGLLNLLISCRIKKKNIFIFDTDNILHVYNEQCSCI